MGHIKYVCVLMVLIYGRNINITKDKIESLLGANKDVALEANAGGDLIHLRVCYSRLETRMQDKFVT